MQIKVTALKMSVDYLCHRDEEMRPGDVKRICLNMSAVVAEQEFIFRSGIPPFSKPSCGWMAASESSESLFKMICYSAIKKNILPFVTVWMDLENIMLSEISQSEKDESHVISLMCGI